MFSHPATHSPAAHLQPADAQRVDHLKNESRQMTQHRPTIGRNTQLGRRVEKPADPRASGPSGQTDSGMRDNGHTNK